MTGAESVKIAYKLQNMRFTAVAENQKVTVSRNVAVD